jgi:hypothetical protein
MSTASGFSLNWQRWLICLGKQKKNVVHTARRCYRLGFAITGSEDGVERLLYGGRNPRPKSKLSHGLEEAEVVTR